ncbi:hypothetical protein GCM10009115_09210 [Sphingopyxis soli]|uniref:Uncharacterized protein n=1 Tax=Sphingopyxis soli TaxID=592051 RepID=A0ABP3XBL5_9SPHN|nr:hypothetical protein [Sphingopyxis soli]
MSAAVVKLPTAASHKVKNGRWKEQRRAGSALRREQGLFDFPLHHNREAVIKAERLADFMVENLPMRAELAVRLGLVQILEPEQVAELRGNVVSSNQALTLIELALADPLTQHLIWTVLQRRGLV